MDRTQEICGNRTARASYNRGMSFGVFAIRLVEILFFVGLVGSAIVVIISFLEDAKELFGED